MLSIALLNPRAALETATELRDQRSAEEQHISNSYVHLNEKRKSKGATNSATQQPYADKKAASASRTTVNINQVSGSSKAWKTIKKDSKNPKCKKIRSKIKPIQNDYSTNAEHYQADLFCNNREKLKSLDFYDCFEEYSLENDEFWESYQEKQKSQHNEEAKQSLTASTVTVRHYRNGEWTMVPCEIIGYDPDERKIFVRMRSGITKWVGRSAVQLGFEDSRKHEMYKAELGKVKLQARLVEQLTKYLDTLSDQTISPIPQDMKLRLSNSIKAVIAKVRSSQQPQTFVKVYLDEVEKEYLFTAKMFFTRFKFFLSSTSINYSTQPPSPFRLLLPYHSVLQQPKSYRHFNRVPFVNKSEIIKRLSHESILFTATANRIHLKILKEGMKLQNISLTGNFGSDFPSMGKPNFNSITVCEAADFFSLLKQQQNEAFQALESTWRNNISYELSEVLDSEFKLFPAIKDKRLKSLLVRLIRKVDLMLSNQMRQLVDTSLKRFKDLLSSFHAEEVVSTPNCVAIARIVVTDNVISLSPNAQSFGAELERHIESLATRASSVTSLGKLCLHKIKVKALAITSDVDVSGAQKMAHKTLVHATLANCLENELVPFQDTVNKYLLVVEPNDPQMMEAKKQCIEFVKDCYKGPKGVLKHLQPYQFLLNEARIDCDINNLELVVEQIKFFRELAQDILNYLPSNRKFSFFELRCSDAIHFLSAAALRWSNLYLSEILNVAILKSQQSVSGWVNIHERIFKPSKDEGEYASSVQFIETIQEHKRPLEESNKLLQAQLEILNTYRFTIPESLIKSYLEVRSWSNRIMSNLRDARKNLETEKIKFKEKLLKEEAEFEEKLHTYATNLSDIQINMNNFKESMKYYSKIFGLRDALHRAEEQSESFAQKRKLFGLESKEFQTLKEIQAAYRPYYKLWNSAIDFTLSCQTWLNGPLKQLNLSSVLECTTEWENVVCDLSEHFHADSITLNVVKEFSAKLLDFKPNIAVMQLLCSESIHQRHWDEILPIVTGDSNDVVGSATIQELLNRDVLAKLHLIEEISTRAQKEYTLEKSLLNMKEEWKGMEVTLERYEQTKVWILKNTDAIQMLLDEQIIKTQTIRCSPLIKPNETLCTEWEAKLLHLLELLEVWQKCQRSWIYLHPLFAAPDIIRQLPVESKLFFVADKIFYEEMNMVKLKPQVSDIIDAGHLLTNFLEANRIFEEVQKGLNDYLESKRLEYSRLFFLSNDELLTILSHTTNPEATQEHLNKIFDGIYRVTFNSGNTIIEAIQSIEGETVQLCHPINVDDGENRGNVEKWLYELEVSMQHSLRKQTELALKAFKVTERVKWLFQWPSQVVLLIDQLMWTYEVEQATQAHQLSDCLNMLNTQLSDVIEMLQMELSASQLSSIRSLITLDVHGRDIVQHLIDSKVERINEFEWISQLRHYWRNNRVESASAQDKSSDTAECELSMMNSALKYRFEYIGPSQRLVLTPLTDRCYRILMGAYELQYGGAPEGPAGTGKTESVKDLAKATGVKCIVFNCSNELDYLAMAKIFKGLAFSGAWCCFDEFNRIEPEVLSVLAQQIKAIQEAVRSGVAYFSFEGTEIKLNSSCAINITMNPGYAGRSELPDNLKALFRPCAMMVADYAMIAEISLLSFGFKNSRVIAKKVVDCLKLATEQLSSQKHYDFQMRALKTTINAVGRMKRQTASSASETAIVVQALQATNVPKLVEADVPLFLDIISDLFPNVERHINNCEEMMLEAVKSNILKLNLQHTTKFVTKCLQLSDTLLERHGVMLVGKEMSGKASALEVLSKATGYRNPLGSQEKCNLLKVNPKSMSLGKLYGQFDMALYVWEDGVLANLFRYAASQNDRAEYWIVLDGPIDADWVESLNTVLDDSKQLCLSNGEVIKITPYMKIVLIVENLNFATPATVSRCGMVYFEPNSVGWEALFQSWLDNFPSIMEMYKPSIQELFYAFLPAATEFIQMNCFCPFALSETNLVAAVIRLFESGIAKRLRNTKFIATKQTLKELVDAYDGESAANDLDETYVIDVFFFSIIWGIGGSIEESERIKFDMFLKQRLQNVEDWSTNSWLRHVLGISYFPKEKTVFDYSMSFSEGRRWTPWLERVETGIEWVLQDDVDCVRIPTMDTVRNDFLIDLLATYSHHVLLAGETGTGKTMCIRSCLANKFSKLHYNTMQITFSASTSAYQLQEMLETPLRKRQRGTFGPDIGKRFLVFVEDLQMPEREVCGAQPPVELLRQCLCTGGWYDTSSQEFKNIVDIQLVSALTLRRGSQNYVAPRFLRHFNIFLLSPYGTESMFQMLYSALSTHFKAFPPSIAALGKEIARASIDLVNSLSAVLLPVPSKPHYTFNIRDAVRITRGLCMTTPRSFNNNIDLLRCWRHECERVLKDRLVDTIDETIFSDQLQKTLRLFWEKQPLETIIGNNPQFYIDFSDPNGQSFYHEATDYEALRLQIVSFLEKYNKKFPKKRMQLVFFQYAVIHLLRLWRILKQTMSHAILVGITGSGRKSLSSLAIFICGYEPFRIETSHLYGLQEWREDMKQLLILSGGQSKKVVLLLEETQLSVENALEDVSHLLNTAEIPNLFNSEEKANLHELCRASSSQDFGTEAEINTYFARECRKNLHIILCVSPSGNSFRKRVADFPSLVNCCTIDWYSDWPREAKLSVAENHLTNLDLENTTTASICNASVSIHESLVQLAHQYKDCERRFVYVPPASFFGLLQLFCQFLEASKMKTAGQQKRYMEGINQLEAAALRLQSLEEELHSLKASLQLTSEETEKLITQINQKQKEASFKTAQVVDEEALCLEQRRNAEVVTNACQAELDAALPAYQAALAALKKLSKGDITELKSMVAPPPGVIKVMEALCKIFRIQPSKTGRDIMQKQKTLNYWDNAKRFLLGDSKFLQRLFNFDKDNIPVDILSLIEPYETDPDFNPETINKASVAATGLCKWILAIITYDRVAKAVNPKRQALAIAQAELDVATENLNDKKRELAETEELVTSLSANLDELKNKKEKLTVDVTDCTNKLTRATSLLTGLEGEKHRWIAATEAIASEVSTLSGSSLLAAAFITYLGPFSAAYRSGAVSEWISILKKLKIEVPAKFSLELAIGDPIKVRNWRVNCLPTDAHSTENAIILTKSKKWPLLIDPQKQGNKWIKAMESTNLKVLRQNQPDFSRHLEAAIQFGSPVLLENAHEELDVLPQSLIQRSTFFMGNVEMISLGDTTIEFNENFRLYITTNLSNPHYLPELGVRLNLLDFIVTAEGLEDQLLSILVQMEEPEVEQRRQQLLIETAQSKEQLQQLEQKILDSLRSAKGSLLDNEVLIKSLSHSKAATQRIIERVVEQEKTQNSIDKIRANYRSVAARASNVFAVVSNLYKLDFMYQFDLEWYKRIYIQSIEETNSGAQDLQIKLASLIDKYQKLLFDSICRSLFERHKLLFCFLLTLKILEIENASVHTQIQLLLMNGLRGVSSTPPKPHVEWLADISWKRIIELDHIGGIFTDFSKAFELHLEAWGTIVSCDDPLKASWPTGLDKNATLLEKCLLMLAIRPDCVIRCMKSMIEETLGKQFLELPQYDLEISYASSTNTIPLIFIGSPGMDPTSSMMEFARTKNMHNKVSLISLGQGQGPKALNALKLGISRGNWVVLQNCHFATKNLLELEQRVEDLNPETTHAEFRLWLTSYPTPDFPVSILKHGIKITKEQPKGLQQNMLSCYLALDESMFTNHPKKQSFKHLLFGLILFHCKTLGRRDFGHLGWNIRYQFTDDDKAISISQLSTLLSSFEKIPIKLLSFAVTEMNYGGRITDVWDRRLVRNLLDSYYSHDFMDRETIILDPALPQFKPSQATIAEHIEYVRSLPLEYSPEWFGLNPNARMTESISEAKAIINDATIVIPNSNLSSSTSSETTVLKLVKNIEKSLPDTFDEELVSNKYPRRYTKSMNSVLLHEVHRYNRLLRTIQKSLSDILAAISGFSLLTQELEAASTSIVGNIVPTSWQAASYLSVKPLAAWLSDLQDRVAFFREWVTNGAPQVFWISGFFFIQSFLTAVKQNYARSTATPIDEMSFDFEFLDIFDESTVTQGPDVGCYVYGLFVEGARWSPGEKIITEQDAKILWSSMPVIWMRPTHVSKLQRKPNYYECPVYTTPQRSGISPATGNSSNYITTMYLPISPKTTEKFWIERGVALLMQKDT